MDKQERNATRTESENWPNGATVRMQHINEGGDSIPDGWAKRDADGRLVSAFNQFPLDASKWTILEERKPVVHENNREQEACTVAICRCGGVAVASMNRHPSEEMMEDLAWAVGIGCSLQQMDAAQVRKLRPCACGLGEE